MMNKKGYSMSGWTEGILMSVLVILIFGSAVGVMNLKYGKDYQIGIGGNTTQSAFSSYQDTLASQIKGGEAVFDAQSGLTLKSSWAIIKSGSGIIWDFLTGGFIETAVYYMKLPSDVAIIFRILYFLSIGFIILWILFKVKP